MKILIVNNTKIPVTEYGGTERVIWWLGKELHRLGHEVTFLVEKGSTCAFAKILEYDPQKLLNEQIPDAVDLVHLHFQTKEDLRKPYLITHHGNVHPEREFNINTVFVSRDHAARNSSDCFVWNGIDPKDYGPVDLSRQRKHLLFLGYAKRLEKNLEDCAYIARKTKNVLAVVGGKHKWFKWRPWMDYRGFLGGQAKNAVLNDSKALLFPVRWHEPFGLAVIEAFYFGCPVFATPFGSLPELVTSELGVLSQSRQELINAVKNLDVFNPKKIHEYALEHFTSKRMTQNYLRLYEKVLAGQKLNPQNPVNGGDFSGEKLLPIFP